MGGGRGGQMCFFVHRNDGVPKMMACLIDEQQQMPCMHALSGNPWQHWQQYTGERVTLVVVLSC